MEDNMAIVNSYSSIVDLKAAPGSGTACLDSSNGVPDGVFFFTSGDFTGSADDINVIKANSTALTVGAWVRQGAASILHQYAPETAARNVESKLRDFVISIKEFEHLVDGDDWTPAFSAAAHFANMRGPQAVLSSIAQSTVIFVPEGRYKINSAVAAFTSNGGTVIRGEGASSHLLLACDGVTFNWDPNGVQAGPYPANGSKQDFAFTNFRVGTPGEVTVKLNGVTQDSSLYTVTLSSNGGGNIHFLSPPSTGSVTLHYPPYDVQGGGLENLQISYPAAPGTSACVARFVTSDKPHMTNITFKGIRTLVQLGDTGKPCAGFSMTDVRGTWANVSGPVIHCRVGTGLEMYGRCGGSTEGINIQTDLESPQLPATNRTTIHPAAADRVGILANGSWDSLNVAGKWFTLAVGLRIHAVSSNQVKNITLHPTLEFDYNAKAVEVFSGIGSLVAFMKVHPGYFVGWDSAAFEITSERDAAGSNHGIIEGVEIMQPTIGACHSYAISAKGPSVRNCFVDGMRDFGSGRNSEADSVSVFVQDGAEFKVRNCSNARSAITYPWAPKYGIYHTANSTVVRVINNEMTGTVANYVFDDNSAASATRDVSGNFYANYSGFKTGGMYGLPASGTAWVNKTGYKIDVTLNGGVVTGISKNGQALPLSSGPFHIGPADTLTITYSSAPTLFFDIQP
jgi:hypothetical protein